MPIDAKTMEQGYVFAKRYFETAYRLVYFQFEHGIPPSLVNQEPFVDPKLPASQLSFVSRALEERGYQSFHTPAFSSSLQARLSSCIDLTSILEEEKQAAIDIELGLREAHLTREQLYLHVDPVF